MNITELTVAQLAEALGKKELSSREVTAAYLSQMEAQEDKIGAYLTVTADLARRTAGEIDEKRAQGAALPTLAGIPWGCKDNLCTQGIATTCASRMLENFVPPYDATVVERLRDQGAVLLGKLNMDEFAMGSSTENSYFHPTRNPRDLTKVPGGSSGGSAAAVAAGEAAFTLGSDTGGSIRQPAAFCGVVGMKPTYGRVSRYGLVAFASSLDQIGPITKNVYDNALVLEAIAGPDPRDSTSLPDAPQSMTAHIREGVQGMRFALPKEYFSPSLSPEIAAAIRAAAHRLETLGAQVDEVSLGSIDPALPAYYVISSAEASSNLSRFDGVKYGFRPEQVSDIQDLYKKSRSQGFGPEVKRRIMLGSFVLSAGYYDAYYKKALQVRTLLKQSFDKLFETYDAILSPVAPTTAYGLGEKTQDPMEMYLGDVYTVPVNIAGLPALSLPCGTDSQGLPIGMQLIGRPYAEPLLYRAGFAFETEGAEL
jgi:aspartyl-tRNA(Asn)/glutamyl-tRNA(Gln) amidotransferase subunit A